MTTITRGNPPRHAGRPRARSTATPVRKGLRVVSAGLTMLVSAASVLLMVIAIASHLSRDSQYTAFGHPLLTVLSGSMSPDIQTGDLIVDDPVSAAQVRHLQRGQIISFFAAPGSTTIITHRIVARKVVRGVVEYQTKGDANNAPDATLRPASDVVGLYAGSIRHGGYILAALHRPIVPVLLALSAALFVLAGPLFRLARDMDNREVGSTN
jgi:signal peptidase